MNNNINTLEQLAEYINNNSEWPLDVEDIIERNGWISDCSEALGVCHDANGNRVVINEQGEVVVI